MGARPLTAMNLVAWPPELGADVLAEVLRGGVDKVAEAGAEMAGGHSIEDKEPKYGLAVTGVARPSEIVYNGGAQARATRLVLTKRLGIGVLASALKNGVIGEDEMRPATEEAAALNASAAAAMKKVGAHACTDVSGFGLAGHLGEMLDASGVGARLRLEDVPVHDGVLELIARAVYAGGLRANRDYVLPRFGAAERRGAGARRAGLGRRAELEPRSWRCSTRRPRAACSSPSRARSSRGCSRSSKRPARRAGRSARSRDGPAGSIALA